METTLKLLRQWAEHFPRSAEKTLVLTASLCFMLVAVIVSVVSSRLVVGGSQADIH